MRRLSPPIALVATLLSLLGPLASPSPAQENAPTDFKPPAGWKSLGRDIWFDAAHKQVVLRGRVCLREGYLEHFLCSTRSKEHESILATEAPPQMIQAGLLLAGLEPGKPVQFQPDFQPPKGPAILIEVEWNDAAGTLQKADGRTWVKSDKDGRELTTPWVFAGSYFVTDPDTGRKRFAAEGGDLITVSNFMSAILDVPFASSASDADRSYVAFTDRIPPLETAVTIYLKSQPAGTPPPRSSNP